MRVCFECLKDEERVKNDMCLVAKHRMNEKIDSKSGGLLTFLTFVISRKFPTINLFLNVTATKRAAIKISIVLAKGPHVMNCSFFGILRH